jgi:hypothetical protein
VEWQSRYGKVCGASSEGDGATGRPVPLSQRDGRRSARVHRGLGKKAMGADGWAGVALRVAVMGDAGRVGGPSPLGRKEFQKSVNYFPFHAK